MDSARRLFTEHPIERVTLDMLGTEAGIERTWVHRWGSRADLYRRSCRGLLAACDGALRAKADVDHGVLRCLNSQATTLASLFAKQEYRDLMRILLRDRSTATWLVEAYTVRIESLCAMIEERISLSGRKLGVSLAAPRLAVAHYVRELELNFAIRAIGPFAPALPESADRKIISRISSELHDAVVVIEGPSRTDVCSGSNTRPVERRVAV